MPVRQFPILFAAGLLTALPAPALAADDSPVATGRVEAPLPKAEPAAPLTTEAAVEDFLAGPQPEPRLRRPHGTVGVAVGSGGYREVDASVFVPVGETGTVAAAVVLSESGEDARARPAVPDGPIR